MEATFLVHFAKEENRGLLWSPDAGAVWEIYNAMVRPLLRPSIPVSASSCQFLKDWAMGAAQAVSDNSYLEIHLSWDP
jgi:hypothetical protein